MPGPAASPDRLLAVRAHFPGALPLVVEAFAAANLAFLTLDIFLAHSANAFRNPAEWIPLAFAPAGALALFTGLVMVRPFHRGAGRWIGLVVGCASIAVGVAGLAWHLNGMFFHTLTLRGLVYSAPFLAPLAFTGLGFLVLLNRMVPHHSLAWAQWVLFLALGGFAGDFGLALVDHAQNGFFNPAEWLAVGSAALAVSFLLLPMLRPQSALFYRVTLGVMALQCAVGLLGFGLHVWPLLEPSPATLRERVLYGPPIFAPLLFADIALLATIALLGLHARGYFPEQATPVSAPPPA